MTQGAAPAPRAVSRLVGLAVAAAILYAGFLLLADGRATLDALARLSPVAVAGAIGLVLAGYALRALRWRRYLAAVEVDLAPGLAVRTFLAGLAMGVTPGKLGEVVKSHYVREATGAPYAKTLPAVLAERVGDLLGVALVLALGLALARPTGWPLLVVCIAVGILVVLALLRTSRAHRAVAGLARIPLLGRLAGPLARVHQDMAPLFRGRPLAEGLLLAGAAWGLEATAAFALAVGAGLPLTWGTIAFVFAAASIAGVLSLLPGGLGVAEGGMVLLLLHAGVEAADAAALTLAVRLATLWLGVAVGALASATLPRAPRRPPEG